jgi:hypothetical protein
MQVSTARVKRVAVRYDYGPAVGAIGHPLNAGGTDLTPTARRASRQARPALTFLV